MHATDWVANSLSSEQVDDAVYHDMDRFEQLTRLYSEIHRVAKYRVFNMSTRDDAVDERGRSARSTKRKLCFDARSTPPTKYYIDSPDKDSRQVKPFTAPCFMWLEGIFAKLINHRDVYWKATTADTTRAEHPSHGRVNTMTVAFGTLRAYIEASVVPLRTTKIGFFQMLINDVQTTKHATTSVGGLRSVTSCTFIGPQTHVLAGEYAGRAFVLHHDVAGDKLCLFSIHNKVCITVPRGECSPVTYPPPPPRAHAGALALHPHPGIL